MKQFYREFLYLLDPSAKKTIPFLIAAFLISSFLDVVGIGLIGIFLGLLSDPTFLQGKFLHISFMQNGFNKNKLIIFSGLLIITAFILKAFISLFIQTRIVFFCQFMSVRIKTRLMHAYQCAPFTFHLQKNTSYLLSRIQDNVNSYINNVLMPTVIFISNGLIVLCILIFLLYMHPVETIFLAVMFAILGVGYSFFAKKKLKRIGVILGEFNGEIIKSIQQCLYGLTEIRVLGKENYFLEQLKRLSSQFGHSYGVLVALQLTPRYLIENGIAIFVVALCLLGIASGSNTANIVAMVGIFGAAGARLLPTVNQLLVSINQIQGYTYQMHLVYEELLEVERKKIFALDSDKSKLDFYQISLNGIYYHYPNSEEPSLNNIEMKFHKGQFIGLIGPSGAGKSTLVNLILGFLEPERGQLLIDGKPITDLRVWLNNFAYIPQSIFLLDDTLQRNIAFGVEDNEVDQEQLMDVINMAQLSEVLKHLPNGVNTMLGENGVRLSGGQRQRVALARALYQKRDIIVMDEATSSLDNATEKEVIDTIKQLKRNKTLIVIAHRLSTVEHCDLIYKLEKGRITSVGSFQEVVGCIG